MSAAGALLMIAALRIGVRPRTLLLPAASLAVRLPWLRCAGDDDTVATRLALAPECRVARAIASAVDVRDVYGLAAGMRLLAAMAVAIPTAALACGVGSPIAAVLLAVSSTMLAAHIPDIALGHAARGAVCDGRRHTAGAVDMLAATASTGLNLAEAMVLTAAHAPPAVAATLRAAAVRRALGEEPCAALHTEARRFGVPHLAAVADAVDRQRRLGVALGPELAAIATRLRRDQRTAALERAARRAPLGTLVVALVITPACLVAVLACLVGGLLQGGTPPPV